MKTFLIFIPFFFFFSTAKLKALEVLKFHVTTIDGEDISDVNIRIIEDPSQNKYTSEDGFCTIWSNTEKFQDVGALIFRKGWTVVKPKLGNYFRIDYRDKTKVIEIQIQQNEEIYQLNKNPQVQSAPIIQRGAILIPEYNASNISSNQEKLSFKIQIKATSTPIQPSLIEIWEQKLALKISEQFLLGVYYPFKYRIDIVLTDKNTALKLLSTVQKSGFNDAFLITDE